MLGHETCRSHQTSLPGAAVGLAGRSMMTLPEGWAVAPLGRLGTWSSGGTPSKSEDYLWRDGSIPWVSPKDMKFDVIETAQDSLNELARGVPGFKWVSAGSVLVVTRSGILRHSLPVATTAREVAFNQDLRALTPFEGIDPRFVSLQLRARSDAVLEASLKAGTTVESLDFNRLKAFELRIAPEEEQKRIVAKLEPLLARCSAVRSDLDRIGKLAAAQRRAVMKATFEPQLRGAASGMLKPGWRVARLSELLDEGPVNGLSPKAVAGDRGTLSLRLTATTSGTMRLDERAVKRVDASPDPESRYWLKPGDLLIQRANALEHVGAAAIFDGPPATYIYPDLMMRVRIGDSVTRRYVWRFLNSPRARQYFQAQASGTAGNMPKITGQTLKALRVPLPPQADMAKLLASLEGRLRRLDAVVAENERCRTLVGKLERALLAKAFEGRLVRQYANAESATVLLGRIQPKPSSNLKEPAVTSTRPRQAVQTVEGYIQAQIAVWPVGGMTFEQLRLEAPGSYDDLKDHVFKLLAAGTLAQRFDPLERKMKLTRLA